MRIDREVVRIATRGERKDEHEASHGATLYQGRGSWWGNARCAIGDGACASRPGLLRPDRLANGRISGVSTRTSSGTMTMLATTMCTRRFVASATTIGAPALCASAST